MPYSAVRVRAYDNNIAESSKLRSKRALYLFGLLLHRTLLFLCNGSDIVQLYTRSFTVIIITLSKLHIIYVFVSDLPRPTYDKMTCGIENLTFFMTFSNGHNASGLRPQHVRTPHGNNLKT